MALLDKIAALNGTAGPARAQFAAGTGTCLAKADLDAQGRVVATLDIPGLSAGGFAFKAKVELNPLLAEIRRIRADGGAAAATMEADFIEGLCRILKDN